jgi:hypothetical protein
MSRLWRRYGGGPGHLLSSLASLAIAAAAVIGWTQRPADLDTVLVWFLAAILLHDLVFLPLYALADRISVGFLPRRSRGYVRAPLLISLLVLAATFPSVLGEGARSARSLSGLPQPDYLLRWLILSGVLFALSGLLYALRRPERAGVGRSLG